MKEQLQEGLKRYWGFDRFRPGQEEIVGDMVAGRDVMAVLPTGGGKSLCYQLPAVLGEGLTVVVSPLIALMADQVAGLNKRGIGAAFLNSSLSFNQREHVWNFMEHGACHLLFVAPETLASDLFQARAPRLAISRIAVDEAHCISEWGHDFRPAYVGIRQAIEVIGPVPVAAFTATATPRVREEIVRLLELRDHREHVFPVDRPNIAWEVHREVNLTARVASLIARVPGSGVLYAGTRSNSESWAAHLERSGVSCRPYHAGLDSREREKTQRAWTSGACRFVAATSAFGMGIDKADVRLVIHTMLPATLEAYYQEAGRAGRDGRAAVAALLASPADDDRLRAWSAEQYPDPEQILRVYNVTCDLGGIAVGSDPDGGLAAHAEAIAKASGVPTGRVHSIIGLLEKMGVWHVERPGRDEAWVQLEGFRRKLEQVTLPDNPEAVRVLAQALLRTGSRGQIGRPQAPAEGAYDRLDLRAIARASGLELARVREGLRFFQARRYTGEVADEESYLLSLQAPRAARPDLGKARIARLRKRAEERARQVVAYAGLRDCRRRMLRTYFGETAPARCGNCDNCR